MSLEQKMRVVLEDNARLPETALRLTVSELFEESGESYVLRVS